MYTDRACEDSTLGDLPVCKRLSQERKREKMKCPKCGSRNVEEHGANPGDHNWWLCRDCGWNGEKTLYRYGMRLRGYSPGCQPNGVIERQDDPGGRYHDILIYSRELTAKELADYELDYLGKEERN